MTRDEFNALVDAALLAIVGSVDPTTDDAAAAREEAQLLEAEASSFADAVDRSARRIDYGTAVMLEGTSGVAVVEAAVYAATPLYWHTVVGKPDRITSGPELMERLTAAARQGAAATP